MTLEQYKQLDDLVLDETNVEELVRPFCKTEKGEIALVYNRKNRGYYWELDKERLLSPTPRLNENIPYFLESWYKNRQ